MLQLINTIYICVLSGMLFWGLKEDPDKTSGAVRGFVVTSFLLAGINVVNLIFS